MNQLFIPVSLDPLHQGVDLKLLLLADRSLVFVCGLVDRFLVFLDFVYFHLVCEDPEVVCLRVFFDGEVTLLLGSERTALFAQGENVVSAEQLLSRLQQFEVVLFSHFPQAFVRSRLIVLHVHVPGIGELDKLLSLYSLNLSQLDLLALLHPTNLSHQLDLGQLFELQPSLLGFNVSLLAFELLVIVIEHPQEGRHLEIR